MDRRTFVKLSAAGVVGAAVGLPGKATAEVGKYVWPPVGPSWRVVQMPPGLFIVDHDAKVVSVEYGSIELSYEGVVQPLSEGTQPADPEEPICRFRPPPHPSSRVPHYCLMFSEALVLTPDFISGATLRIRGKYRSPSFRGVLPFIRNMHDVDVRIDQAVWVQQREPVELVDGPTGTIVR